MGINNDSAKWFQEQIRRSNTYNYNQTFPYLLSFEKVGSVSSDPDHEDSAFDFSVTPAEYEIAAFSKSDSYVKELHCTLYTDSTLIRADRYGCIVGGLTNGLILALYQDGEYKFVSPTINTNMEYERFFNGNFNFPEWNGDVVVTATLTLDVPVILRAGTDDRFVWQVSDDLSQLNAHYFAASGWQTRVIDVDNRGYN